MSDTKSPKQADKNAKQNLFLKAKSFFKGYRAPRYLVVGSIAFLTVTLILSAFALWSSNQSKDTAFASSTVATAFNPSDCATYVSNGGTNTGGICFVKMYEKSGVLYKSLDIAPGELVNVRNYYNNTTTSSVTAANITDSIPSGFSRVGNVTNNYVDAAPVTLNNNVFTGQNLTVAPGAGYFGYSADNSVTSSNLELGKFKYFNLNECDYNQGNVNITYNRTPAGVPSNTIPGAINCGATGYGAGGPATTLSIDIAGKRNLYIAECDYNTSNSTITYNRTGNNGATNGTVPATNCVTTGYVFSGAAQLNFDLLGNRYVHLTECDYTGGTITYNRTGNYTANNNSTLSVVCSATGFGAAVGGTSISSDLSDTTRGYGYIGYSMQTPTTGLTNGQTFGTTGTLNASGAQTSNKTGSLAVINANSANVQSGIIPSDCTTYPGGTTSSEVNGDGTACVAKVYVKNGIEYNTMEVAPGETVTVRLRYNNSASTSADQIRLKDNLPTGWTLAGNAKAKYVDSAVSDLGTAASVFNAPDDTGLDVPVSTGFFGANAGTLATDPASNLELGKKRYLNINQCQYSRSGGETFVSTANFQGVPGGPGFGAATNFSNTAGANNATTCGTGGSGYLYYGSLNTVLDGVGKRYLNVNQCQYYASTTADNFVTTAGLQNNFGAGTNFSNTAGAGNSSSCGAGSAGTPYYGSLNTPLDSLGKRYLNRVMTRSK
jgi:hypothetical protein